jgi:hypothetical protein
MRGGRNGQILMQKSPGTGKRVLLGGYLGRKGVGQGRQDTLAGAADRALCHLFL